MVGHLFKASAESCLLQRRSLDEAASRWNAVGPRFEEACPAVKQVQAGFRAMQNVARVWGEVR